MFSNSTFSERSLTFCRWSAIITAISAPISTAATNISIVAMLLAWLASGEALRSLKISAEQAAGKMFLLFFAWLILGTLYANTPWGDKIDTLLSWKKLAFTFLLFGLFYQAHWKKLFVKSYLIVMVAAALIAVSLWLADFSVRPERDPGIFMTNYSSQSMAFIAAVVCCIFLLKQQLSTEKKLLLGAVIALFIFNIFFVSAARSGYIAFPFAVVFALYCLYGFKKLPYILGITGIALTIIAFTSTTFQQRTEKGLTEKANYQNDKELTSIGFRVNVAKNTVELIKERPVFGYGTSSFKATYSPYVANKYSDWRGAPTTDPHNQYLFVWLENGLIGLLLFLAYIYIAIRQGLKYQPYGTIAASVLVAVCASSLFNSHFKTFPEGYLLAFFVGILLAQHNYAPSEDM
jgi:O-antigen ligase